MGIPNGWGKTLVFRKVEGCMCTVCLDKIGKVLGKNQTIKFDAVEEKLTIKGSNIDPNMVIAELGKIKRVFEFVSDDSPILDGIEELVGLHQMEAVNNETNAVVVDKEPAHNQMEVIDDSPILDGIEEQVGLHRREVVDDETNAVVIYKEPAHNQMEVIDFPTLRTPDLRSSDNCQHEFELKNYEKRFACNGCKEEGFKPRYRCKHCDYELHEDCMRPKPTISHQLFGDSIFKFSREKPTCGTLCGVHTKSCEACGNTIHGYSYHCEANDKYLHPMCVNFRGNECIEGETFTLEKNGTFPCFWCQASKDGTNSGWAYVSKSLKCQLHVNCIAKFMHGAWKEKNSQSGEDAYITVLEKRLNLGIIKNKKKKEWLKGGKFVKMILIFARTIIGILLGDPTVILASMLVEVLKK